MMAIPVQDARNRAEFVSFVETLLADYRAEQRRAVEEAPDTLESGSQGWENTSLERFLEAMAGWGHDSADREGAEPSWQQFTRFLRAGRGYE